MHTQAVTNTDNSLGEVGKSRQSTLGNNECYHYCNYIESQVIYSTSLESTFNITYTQHYLPLTLIYNHKHHVLSNNTDIYATNGTTFKCNGKYNKHCTNITTHRHCNNYNTDPQI